MWAPVGAGVDGVAGCDRALWSLELAGAEAAAAAFVNSLAPLESSAREAAPARIQLKEMEIFFSLVISHSIFLVTILSSVVNSHHTERQNKSDHSRPSSHVCAPSIGLYFDHSVRSTQNPCAVVRETLINI